MRSQLGREVAPGVWWFHWRVPPLTSGDLSRGVSETDIWEGTPQVPGTIIRGYAIAVNTASGCQTLDCLPVRPFSKPLTRTGTFPRTSAFTLQAPSAAAPSS